MPPFSFVLARYARVVCVAAALALAAPGAHAQSLNLLEDDAAVARRVIALLDGAAQDGLDPAHYDAAGLRARVDADPDDAGAAALQADLLATFLRYARDVRAGRVRERSGEQAVFDPPPAPDPVVVHVLDATEDVAALRAWLRPPGPAYAALVRALADYRALAQRGAFPTVPDGPAKVVTAPDFPPEQLAALHARLSAGDGTAPTAPDAAAVAVALRAFQARHGLKADAIPGRATRAALAVSADARVAQIALALERARWDAASPLPDGIEVNIPGYALDYRRGGESRLTSAVVVGLPDWPTPVFETRATAVQFNPHWNVPTSIVRTELLPKVRRRPEYLAAQGIEVLDGWGEDAPVLDPATLDWNSGRALGAHYRQRPGPKNPLGRLKLHMPNSYSVFLHDSPARPLFDVDARALSHGCVRVARARELAALLLAGDGDATAGAATVDAALTTETPQRVALAQPIVVRTVYRTAWVDADGVLQLRADIYGRDRALAAALKKPSPDAPGLPVAAGTGNNPVR